MGKDGSGFAPHRLGMVRSRARMFCNPMEHSNRGAEATTAQ
jgi:hypothetical protein